MSYKIYQHRFTDKLAYDCRCIHKINVKRYALTPTLIQYVDVATSWHYTELIVWANQCLNNQLLQLHALPWHKKIIDFSATSLRKHNRSGAWRERCRYLTTMLDSKRYHMRNAFENLLQPEIDLSCGVYWHCYFRGPFLPACLDINQTLAL